MSREAWILAVVGVLGALTLGGASFARDDAREAPTFDRPLFAGSFEADGAATERGARPWHSGARLRGGAGSRVAIRSGRALRLRERPGGRTLAVLGARTPFGSAMVLPVVRRRAGWLGVLASALPNGRVGWIRDDGSALTHARTRVRVLVDRSDRRLVLVRDGREVASAEVGVGRPGAETPIGHFAVTDKLDGGRFARGYGCCILALSGRQPNLPAGWRGGDRLAIHGTNGASASRVRSAGCVALDEAPLRRLMETVPLGTRVTIRP
ncbi:MAG TPA: L,D-transpeptidase [Thermoleophilaceae bacterium]